MFTKIKTIYRFLGINFDLKKRQKKLFANHNEYQFPRQCIDWSQNYKIECILYTLADWDALKTLTTMNMFVGGFSKMCVGAVRELQLDDDDDALNKRNCALRNLLLLFIYIYIIYIETLPLYRTLEHVCEFVTFVWCLLGSVCMVGGSTWRALNDLAIGASERE